MHKWRNTNNNGFVSTMIDNWELFVRDCLGKKSELPSFKFLLNDCVNLTREESPS